MNPSPRYSKGKIYFGGANDFLGGIALSAPLATALSETQKGAMICNFIFGFTCNHYDERDKSHCKQICGCKILSTPIRPTGGKWRKIKSRILYT